MEREPNASESHIDLKNEVGYRVQVGYRIYNSTYAGKVLGASNWNSERALYEGQSGWLEFYWWDIDSATTLAAVVVTPTAILICELSKIYCDAFSVFPFIRKGFSKRKLLTTTSYDLGTCID